MKPVFSYLHSTQLTQEKTAVKWIHHFYLSLLHAQYFTLINLNVKLQLNAESSFSLLLILLDFGHHPMSADTTPAENAAVRGWETRLYNAGMRQPVIIQVSLIMS